MRVKLTDRFLRTYRPAKTEEVFDLGGTAGFGARFGPRGATFFLVYRKAKKKHRVTVGRYDASGRLGLTLADARREAERIRGNRLHPAAERRRAREAGTFEDVARRFLEDMPRAKRRANQAELRPSTAAEYRRQLENKLIPHFGDMSFTEITRHDVEDFFDNYAKGTPIQANRCFALVRRLYNWGLRKGYATQNPCAALEAPGGKEEPRERNWTNEEIRNVWKALESERPMIANYFRFVFLTALRRGESMKIKWSWIDSERALLRVPAEANKTARTKELPLVRPALEILNAVEQLSGHTEHVFIGPSGKALTTIQKAKERIAKRSGVDFRTHDIRHCVASRLVELGIDLDTIASILGHVVGQKVTRIYAHGDRLPRMRQALESWAKELERIVSWDESEADVLEFRR